MTFEKEFPTLKGKGFACNPGGWTENYTQAHIEEYCFDKERVREAIKEYIVEQTPGIKLGLPINPFKLLEKLGIEQEREKK